MSVLPSSAKPPKRSFREIPCETVFYEGGVKDFYGIEWDVKVMGSERFGRRVVSKVPPFHPNLTDELSDWVVSLQRTEEVLVREINRLERRNSQLKWLAGYMLMGLGVSLVLACLH